MPRNILLWQGLRGFFVPLIFLYCILNLKLKMSIQIITANYLKTISWRNNEIVDWAGHLISI